MKPISFLLLLINVVLLVLGQTLWKLGLAKVPLTLSLSGILKVIFQPYIFAGLFIYVIATVIWFFILKEAPLSMAYPLQSLCYVVSAFVALFLFREAIPPARWLGLALIVSGVFFIAR